MTPRKPGPAALTPVQREFRLRLRRHVRAMAVAARTWGELIEGERRLYVAGVQIGREYDRAGVDRNDITLPTRKDERTR